MALVYRIITNLVDIDFSWSRNSLYIYIYIDRYRYIDR